MANYLLIVEGGDERIIFEEVFKKYGFNVKSIEGKINIEEDNHFEGITLEKNKDNIILIEGPRNRIHDFLKLYNEKTDSIEKFFHFANNNFQGIFFIYDVDHNDNDDIDEMFNKFQDELSGMLLLNSPCLEVVGDENHSRVLITDHLRNYKKMLNIESQKINKCGIVDFIKKDFNRLVLYYLEKNKNDFEETNVMEHPHLVKDKINEINIRINDKEKSYVEYRYFTTVVYVMIAYINKLTIDIDNYDKVYDFFKSKEN